MSQSDARIQLILGYVLKAITYGEDRIIIIIFLAEYRDLYHVFVKQRNTKTAKVRFSPISANNKSLTQVHDEWLRK